MTYPDITDPVIDWPALDLALMAARVPEPVRLQARDAIVGYAVAAANRSDGDTGPTSFPFAADIRAVVARLVAARPARRRRR
jgi:hypothetical protein